MLRAITLGNKARGNAPNLRDSMADEKARGDLSQAVWRQDADRDKEERLYPQFGAKQEAEILQNAVSTKASADNRSGEISPRSQHHIRRR